MFAERNLARPSRDTSAASTFSTNAPGGTLTSLAIGLTRGEPAIGLARVNPYQPPPVRRLPQAISAILDSAAPLYVGTPSPSVESTKGISDMPSQR